MLAAIDLNVGAELLFHFVTKEVPTFQMTGAQFALGVFLVAGSHARGATFDLGAIAERVDHLRNRDGLVGNRIFRVRHSENVEYIRWSAVRRAPLPKTHLLHGKLQRTGVESADREHDGLVS